MPPALTVIDFPVPVKPLGPVHVNVRLFGEQLVSVPAVRVVVEPEQRVTPGTVTKGLGY